MANTNGLILREVAPARLYVVEKKDNIFSESQLRRPRKVLDILFYGAGLLAGVGAAVLCIVEVRKGQVLPTIGSALVALMAFATLGLGVFRDHKSNQELVRINEQNLSLRDWIGPREVNKNALRAIAQSW